MATEKLAEGVRKFAEDTVKLENILKEKFAAFVSHSIEPEANLETAIIKDLPESNLVTSNEETVLEKIPVIVSTPEGDDGNKMGVEHECHGIHNGSNGDVQDSNA